MKKPLQCLLGLHSWKNMRNEEGQRYQLCLPCGVSRDKLSLNDFGGGGAGGG
ncbi:hypothetical protein EV643_101519 [Kribbella sp. VKM Ac-2527]|uniref:Uncharacterized protein n=1 Tax=Kribbella caucasensis TaxID=2512215 RepID=A0A4R6KQQ8_9ACTN|nr:hypothetical protein [Kribbella sp. VKM Ac-2527]TDO54729.1 hypothetical protein EV643_101519 [Kribbella sp. VKM Ac-2527]